MKVKLTRIYLLSILLLGLVALCLAFLQKPGVSDAMHTFRGSYQGNLRIAAAYTLMGAVGLITLLALSFLLVSSLNKNGYRRLVSRAEAVLDNRKWFFAVVLVLFGIVFVSGQLFLSVGTQEDPLHTLFLRISQPVFLFGVFLGLGGVVLSALISDHGRVFTSSRVVVPSAIFIILFGLGFTLLQLGYGHTVTEDITGNFDLAGYPVLGYQVVLAWLISTAIFLIARWIHKRVEGRSWNTSLYFDLATAAVLFLTAFFLWKGVPLKPHYHIDPPTPPNFEPYPDSDALFYDRSAQGVLAAGNFQSYTRQKYVTRRPILALYLAVLHQIGGLGYEEIIPIQTAFFSLLPVLVYLLAKSLHTRLSGVLAASIIILREYNGLLLSDKVTGVHSQLLMSEIPTQMGVVLVIYLFVLWVKRPQKRVYLPIIAGGVLGLTMLIRQESGAILPFLSLGALIALRKNLRLYLQGMLLLGVSLMLVLIPWVYRNYHLTGKIFLDAPGNRLSMIRETLEIEKFQDQDSYHPDASQLYAANSIQSAAARTPGHLAKPAGQLKRHPILEGNPRSQNQDSTIDLMVNHFTNQLVLSTVYLPSYPLIMDIDYLAKFAIGKLENYYGGALYSPHSYVKALPYWWVGWDGSVAPHSLLPVTLILVLVSIGVFGIWKRHRWVSILPFMAMLGHFTIYAVVRISGGRYVQEVDWITGMYYAVGIAEVTILGWRWLGEKNIKINRTNEKPILDKGPNPRTIPILMVGMIGIGLMLPLFEAAHPNHYPDLERQTKLDYLLSSSNTEMSPQEIKQVQSFLNNGGLSVWGRGLYPQHIKSKEPLGDFPATDVKLKEIGTFPRMRFNVIGSEMVLTLLERDSSPSHFPHGTDVLVIGCKDRGLMHALFVAVYDQEGDIVRTYWRDEKFETVNGCPLPDLKQQ